MSKKKDTQSAVIAPEEEVGVIIANDIAEQANTIIDEIDTETIEGWTESIQKKHEVSLDYRTARVLFLNFRELISKDEIKLDHKTLFNMIDIAVKSAK